MIETYFLYIGHFKSPPLIIMLSNEGHFLLRQTENFRRVHGRRYYDSNLSLNVALAHQGYDL